MLELSISHRNLKEAVRKIHFTILLKKIRKFFGQFVEILKIVEIARIVQKYREIPLTNLVLKIVQRLFDHIYFFATNSKTILL